MAFEEHEIQVLTFVDAVRKRPGMYFGDVDRGAMHNLLWELVGNAIDEHRAGFGSFVRVAIDGDAITIEDDGRGIPPEALEIVMTRGHAGSAAFRKEHVHLRRGLMGVGVAAVNALCAHLEIEVRRDGRRHAQSFARGIALDPVHDVGPCDRTGTRITFVPDFTILAPAAWDRAVISRRLREIAAMTPRLTVILDHHAVRCPDGLVDHVRYLAERAVQPFAIAGHCDGIGVEAAIAWTGRERPLIRGYVGMAPANGEHVEGLIAGIGDAFVALDPRLARVDRAALREVIEPGVIALVHVTLEHPRFGNPSRDWLDNPEVAPVTAAIVGEQLHAALAAHELGAALLARLPRG